MSRTQLIQETTEEKDSFDGFLDQEEFGRELQELIRKGDKKGFAKKMEEYEEKFKEAFLKNLPDAMGYGENDSNLLFVEMYVDDEGNVSVAKGDVADYETDRESRIVYTPEDFYKEFKDILTGYNKHVQFPDADGAEKAYQERLAKHSIARKEGLLTPLYDGTERIEFMELNPTYVTMTHYDGVDIINYEKLIEASDTEVARKLRVKRGQLFREGFGIEEPNLRLSTIEDEDFDNFLAPEPSLEEKLERLEKSQFEDLGDILG